jgi:formate dehydrogenase major subunit
VRAEDETLTGLECVRMELGEPDASGRRRPVPVKGSETVLPADVVIAAIGQGSNLKGLVDGDGLPKANRWGTFEADPQTGATSVPGVFAAGDAVTGPQAVIDAIGAGRKAALAIQRYLDLGEIAAPPAGFASKRFGEVTKDSIEVRHDVVAAPRAHAPALPPEERTGFREVEFAITQEAAVREAARCLQCGCVAFEECDLRKYADEYGADPTPYLGDSPRRRIDTRHPWITVDPNKCILCNRCVRTCTEILGVSALGLIGRGFETRVAPALDKSLLEAGCVTCGSCVEACPTGTLSFAGIDAGRWRPTAKTLTTCGFCGVGCTVEARRHGDTVTIRSQQHGDGAFSDLCVRGRFGHDVLGGKDRLTTPLVRREGVLVEAAWDEAIEAAVQGLADVKRRHGAGALAVTASPRVPCEDAWAAATLARAALGTKNAASLELLVHRPDADPLGKVFGATASTIDKDELAQADVILLVGSDPSELRPVAALAIRRAVARGAKLVVIGSGHTPLTDLASVWLNARRGTATVVLAAMAADIAAEHGWPAREGAAALQEALALLTPESFEAQAGISAERLTDAASLLCRRDAPGRPAGHPSVAVVADLDEPLERAPDHLVALGDLLLLLEHANGTRPGLLLLSAHANAVGVRAAGLDGEAALRHALYLGDVRAAWIVGEDPGDVSALAERTDALQFLVVSDDTLTETARQADVVFPLATHLEAGGTFVSASGVAKALTVLAPPAHGRTAADVLLAAARKLGWADGDTPDRAAITAKLAKEKDIVPGQRVPTPTAEPRFVPPSLAVRATHPNPPTLLAPERRAADRIRLTLGRSGPRA